tara:strand:+ start:617 stop:1237 length:621 start_codon:yes stop_codon:yes gene_type:complete
MFVCTVLAVRPRKLREALYTVRSLEIRIGTDGTFITGKLFQTSSTIRRATMGIGAVAAIGTRELRLTFLTIRKNIPVITTYGAILSRKLWQAVLTGRPRKWRQALTAAKPAKRRYAVATFWPRRVRIGAPANPLTAYPGDTLGIIDTGVPRLTAKNRRIEIIAIVLKNQTITITIYSEGLGRLFFTTGKTCHHGEDDHPKSQHHLT